MHNLAIFQALTYLEPETYSKPCETLIKHIQSPVTIRTVCSDIIQLYSDIIRTLCNACICRNFDLFGILEYSEAFHNCIPTHIQSIFIFTKTGKPCVTLEIQNPGILTILDILRTLTYLKTGTYSEPSQRCIMKCFAKIDKINYHYFFQSALSYMFDRALNTPISQ